METSTCQQNRRVSIDSFPHICSVNPYFAYGGHNSEYDREHFLHHVNSEFVRTLEDWRLQALRQNRQILRFEIHWVFS